MVSKAIPGNYGNLVLYVLTQIFGSHLVPERISPIVGILSKTSNPLLYTLPTTALWYTGVYLLGTLPNCFQFSWGKDWEKGETLSLQHREQGIQKLLSVIAHLWINHNKNTNTDNKTFRFYVLRLQKLCWMFYMHYFMYILQQSCKIKIIK